MSILVTGGMGAIGSFVTRHLVDMGAETIVYSRHKDTILLSDMESKMVIVEGDITDFDKLVQTIKAYGVDRIIHASAMLTDAGSSPVTAIRVNVEGTAKVLDAALQCNVKRVVYTSAKGVYNEATGAYGHPTYKPITEDYPAEANMGFYGLTKLFGEKVGFQYFREKGVDFIALRFSSTFGPGKLLKHGATSPMSVHGRMIEHAMLGKPFRHPTGADQIDDLIYNKDTAKGIVLACFAEKPEHRIFNIGSGQGATLRDLAAAVRKSYPDADIEIGPGLDYFNIGHNVYSVYDISRAKKELGYAPEYSLEAGVRDYVEMMRTLKIEPVYTPGS
jgi:UDP-glucose 4-epimerase